MRMHANKMCVGIAVFVAAGLIGASAGSAQETQPKQAEKTHSTLNAEDSRQIEQDAHKAKQDAIRAGEDARKAAEAAAADHAREFQFKFATPIMADVQLGNPAAVKIRKAAEDLRDAKDDDAKAKATAQLRELLDKYFEEDMTHRQKELEGIEARLQKLHAQLERRRAKKQDIIDLQVKMSVNEADGLGFYSQPTGGPFNFFTPAPAAITLGSGDGNEVLVAPSADIVPPPPAEAPVPAVPPVPRAPQAPQTTYKNT